MGKELFEMFPGEVTLANNILGYSIKELCLEDPNGVLNKTEFTQPALYIVNALMHLQSKRMTTRLPDYVLGHSLGEYNALLAAEIIDFETGLRLVMRRGKLMGQVHGGGMAAILNCDKTKIASILKKNNLALIDLANLNSPQQIVISGADRDISSARACFEEEGVIFIPLKVSAAFHSRYMHQASREFEEILAKTVFSPSKIPVISNVDARIYSMANVRGNLAKQISSPVQWIDSIRFLLDNGVTQFEEIGPGNVLTKLVRNIQSERKANPTHITAYVTQDNNCEEQKTINALKPENLGSDDFKRGYGLRYAYVSGSMVKGIASKELVVAMGKAGLMGYFGAGGLSLSIIESALQFIQQELTQGESYGVNLLCQLNNPLAEMALVDLLLKYGVTNIEAAAYTQASPALIKFRLRGLEQDSTGKTIVKHRIMAKISRPEVAEIFLRPPAQRIVNQLLDAGEITLEQSRLAETVSLADELCVEADSGGHTDMGNMAVLLPTIIRVRDLYTKKGISNVVSVGAAGGIGTPEAAAAAFILGAEFILTGSINQCTVEAAMSDEVKDMLSQLNVQDTDYAPAGDMFEMGAKIQVMKKGVFFPGRANKLYDLWRYHQSWEEIDKKTRQQIEEKYFGRSFSDVYEETKEYYLKISPQEIQKAEKNPKNKLALVFKWYFVHTMRLARNGVSSDRVNYQVHTGPAIGSFNQWVEGTPLEDWRSRYVAEIGERLMGATADFLRQRIAQL